MSVSCKHNVALSIVNTAMLYVMDDVMKIKLAADCHNASACSDLSTNKSLNLTIG